MLTSKKPGIENELLREKMWIARLPAIAIIILVKGPAKDTIAKSFLPSLRLNGSTGTGLAPPKITFPPLEKKVMSGNRIVM